LFLDETQNISMSQPPSRKRLIPSQFHLAFDFDVGNLPIIQQWIKFWKNNNIVKRERFIETYNTNLLLDCLKTVKINLDEEIIFDEDYKMLLKKTKALLTFFIILRPNELANLNIQSPILQDDGALLYTTIKTANDQLVNIFIPKVKNTRICP
jgi:hypothetical protein